VPPTSRKNRKSAAGLADPTHLAPIDEHDLTVVIVETPKGSRNKYAFDPDEHIFQLRKVLPAGMAFPYDFGNHSYTHIKHIDDLGKRFERELEEFFVNYHRLDGAEYRILSLKGPDAARHCIKRARKRTR